MKLTDKILILGANGMVGSALVRELLRSGHSQVLAPKRQELNLLEQDSVDRYFAQYKPTYVILAAAKVGGIEANRRYPADFIFQNLQIQNNVFGASDRHGVSRFLFLGSSCIYPKLAPQPIPESALLTSPLEMTNESYAIAKIAGLKTAAAFRHQFGREFFSAMPTNLYGENDNFHPQNSHVIPGLIQRMQKTIEQGLQEFEIWGTGTPRREFLYVDDLAKACIFLMNQPDFKKLPDWINVGTGEDVAIGELAKMIGKKMGFKGEYKFNLAFPDGTPRKLLNVSELQRLGWKHTTELSEGLDKTIQFFREHHAAKA